MSTGSIQLNPLQQETEPDQGSVPSRAMNRWLSLSFLVLTLIAGGCGSSIKGMYSATLVIELPVQGVDELRSAFLGIGGFKYRPDVRGEPECHYYEYQLPSRVLMYAHDCTGSYRATQSQSAYVIHVDTQNERAIFRREIDALFFNSIYMAISKVAAEKYGAREVRIFRLVCNNRCRRYTAVVPLGVQ